MFTAEQYRAKAAEYSKLANMAIGLAEIREFQNLERSFSDLANNAEWLTDHHDFIYVKRDEPVKFVFPAA